MRSTIPAGRNGPELRPYRRKTALIAALLLVLGGLLGLVQAAGSASADASDYTQSVALVTSTSAKITFTPTTPAVYVDVHYTVNAAGQQNVRMTNTSGVWTWTVSTLTTGSVLEYWFTYEKSGPQYDTPHFTYTQGGSTTTTTSPPPAGTVATPTFNPAGGSYSTAQSVTISDTTSGA